MQYQHMHYLEMLNSHSGVGISHRLFSSVIMNSIVFGGLSLYSFKHRIRNFLNVFVMHVVYIMSVNLAKGCLDNTGSDLRN